MKHLCTHRGFTLIEIMVGVAISTVVILAFLGLLNAVMKTQKYVNQRYEIQDLSNTVRLAMMQTNFCSCNFPNDVNLTTGTLPVLLLRNFDPTNCATPTGTVLTASPVNNLVPGTSTALRVQSMQMQNLQILSQPTPASRFYSFDLSVAFDPTSTTVQMKPLVITGLTMITTASATVPLERISSCAVANAGGSSLTATQLCLMLGGVFLQSGSCSFPTIPGNVASGTAPTPSGLGAGSGSPSGSPAAGGGTAPTPDPGGTPKGTVVANCYTATNGGTPITNCAGGAAPPSTCPPGTKIDNYYSLQGVTTSFQCVTE
jgi:prepilin-type N-terminal cleavage/methylation domain-containing protein